LLALCLPAALLPALGQPLSGGAFVSALRSGGYVILMRHASSPRTSPDAAQANADNVEQQRQLDEVGRSSARAFGQALRQLKIPIGRVLSSPTYRALETVRLANLGVPRTMPQLGDSGQSMQADRSGERAIWVRSTVAVPPPAGTNTIIVTHLPNISEAFPQSGDGLADGEALIFHPDGHGAASLVSRVRIDEWTQLAAVLPGK